MPAPTATLERSLAPTKHPELTELERLTSHLTPADIEELGARFEAIRQRVIAERGYRGHAPGDLGGRAPRRVFGQPGR